MKLKFSSITLRILGYSRDEALRTGHLGIRVDHLMLGILRDGDNEAVEILRECGAEPKALKAFLDECLFREEALAFAELDNILLTAGGRSMLGIAGFEALKRGSEEIKPEHMLLAACLTKGNAVNSWFEVNGINYKLIAERVLERKSAEKDNAVTAPDMKEIYGAIGEQLGNLFKSGGSDGPYS